MLLSRVIRTGVRQSVILRHASTTSSMMQKPVEKSEKQTAILTSDRLQVTVEDKTGEFNFLKLEAIVEGKSAELYFLKLSANQRKISLGNPGDPGLLR